MLVGLLFLPIAQITHESILIIFGKNVPEKVGNQIMFYFATQLTSASALPGEMKKDKNSILSLNVL